MCGLLAFWTAFAPQRFYHRALWGLLLCACLGFAVELGALLQSDIHQHGYSSQVGFFLSIDLILFFLATPLLLLVRRFSRWGLMRRGEEQRFSHYQANQFGIKHLLILTAITALVCSLFSTLAKTDSSLSVQPIGMVAAIVVLISAVLLPTLLIPWVTLRQLKRLPLSIVFGIGLFVIDALACNFLFRIAPRSEQLRLILLIQFGAGLSVAASTLVMRWCGFRMIREPANHGGAVARPIGQRFAIREVAHGSPEYWATVDVRDWVLRKPLGLEFSIEELQGENNSFHFASYCGGRVIACLVLRPLDAGEMRMRQLAVVPELQRRGIGRALVAYSEAWASGAGYRRMILHARETAVAFYEKAGYSRRGDRFEEVSIPHWAMEKRLT